MSHSEICGAVRSAPAARGKTQTLSICFVMMLGCSLCAAVAQTPSMEQLVQGIARSGSGLSFRGTLVTMISTPRTTAQTTTRRIIRSANAGVLIINQQPPGAFSVDDGRTKRSYDPRTRTITRTNSLFYSLKVMSAQRKARLIMQNYIIHMEGRDAIAGRSCYRLSLIPRDPLSRPVKIWVDAATGLPLCHQESDRQGNTLDLTLFTSIDFPRSIPEHEVRRIFPRKAHEAVMCKSPIFREISSLKKVARFPVYQPNITPAGYLFDQCELVQLGGAPTSILRYTDGISLITICQSRAKSVRPSCYRLLQSAIHPMGDNMVAYDCGAMDYRVLGHRDKESLIALARSMDTEGERKGLNLLSKTFHVPAKVLTRLRAGGDGLDTITALLMITRHSRKSLAYLESLSHDGWGWRSLAKRFHLREAQIELIIAEIIRS